MVENFDQLTEKYIACYKEQIIDHESLHMQLSKLSELSTIKIKALRIFETDPSDENSAAYMIALQNFNDQTKVTEDARIKWRSSSDAGQKIFDIIEVISRLKLATTFLRNSGYDLPEFDF